MSILVLLSNLLVQFVGIVAFIAATFAIPVITIIFFRKIVMTLGFLNSTEDKIN